MPETPEDRLYREVGRIAVAASHLEFRVSLLAAALLGLPQRVGLFLVARDNFSKLTERVGATLVVTSDTEALIAIRTWLQRARDAYSRRNEIVHSQVSYNPESQSYVKTKLRSRLDGPAFSSEPFDFGTLAALSDDLDGLCAEFDRELTTLMIRDLPYTRQALGHPAP